MKRQIKFRGKRTDTGEWIYGDLLTSNGTECEISDWNDIVYSRYDVDPDTVGQFTGLLDKNGKEIYEGDILSCSVGNEKFDVRKNKHIGEVVWIENRYTFKVQGSVNADLSNVTVICEFEVIGNIHDNPELLKGGKE